MLFIVSFIMIYVKKKCIFLKDFSVKIFNEESGVIAVLVILFIVMAFFLDGVVGSVEGVFNLREIIRVVRGLINETIVR